MDLDDTDGAGPENFNLSHLTSGASYDVGVHYWDPHDLGTSYASIRIWVHGELVHTVEGVAMQGLDLWHVGRIHWPNKVSHPGVSSAEPFEPCRQSVPPCQGGKRWLPVGDPCIASCYDSPAIPPFAPPIAVPGCGP